MNSILISVGVSSYSNAIIPPLVSASNDALRVVELFKLLGISQTILLQDDDATRKKILNAISVEPYRIIDSIETVIFYYAGHGEAIINPLYNNKDYFLYCHDSDFADIAGTSINILEILSSITKLNPNHVYLFIDACYIKLPILPDISHFKLSNSNDAEHSFFGLIATNAKKAYENKVGGVFTSALLQSLVKMRMHEINSCSNLSNAIRSILLLKNYDLPEAYWQGNKDINLFDKIDPVYEFDGNYIKRTDSLIKIVYELLKHDYKCICFFGDALSGKTILAKQLCNCFHKYIYCSIKFHDSVVDIKHKLAQLLAGELSENSCILSTDNFEAVYAYYLRENISFSIVFDHAERAHDSVLSELYENFNSDNVSTIFFARRAIITGNCININLPELSNLEIEEFIRYFGKEDNILLNSIDFNVKKSPMALINFLQKSSLEYINRYENAICKICKCDGLINIKLFCEVFDIDINQILYLLDKGLLQKENTKIIPHEILYDLFNLNKDEFIVCEESEAYWQLQYTYDYNNVTANNVLITMLIRKGINWIQDKSTTLKHIILHCIKSSKWDELEVICLNYLTKFPSLYLLGASSLVHVAREKVIELFDSYELFSEEQTLCLKVLKSEILYWKGDFDESINLCEELIEINPNNQIDNLYLNMAISYFFIGEWELANSYVDKININANGRILGWKRLISGTIFAIRGVDFKKGLLSLTEAIELLEQINDTVGLSIAFNNLGECYFKQRNFTSAEFFLLKADLMASLNNDKATLLEIQRNLLLTEINKNCAYNNRALQLSNRVLELMGEVTDKTELMQVYNTFAIAEAYNFNLDSTKSYIDLAHELTQNNKEYSIYTYIARAICSFVEQKNDFFQETDMVLKLSKEGNNLFAVLQLYNDIINISKIYSLLLTDQFAEKLGEVEGILKNAGINI